MENVTDVYTGPCSPESRYIKPFTIHYKQVRKRAVLSTCHVSVTESETDKF